MATRWDNLTLREWIRDFIFDIIEHQTTDYLEIVNDFLPGALKNR